MVESVINDVGKSAQNYPPIIGKNWSVVQLPRPQLSFSQVKRGGKPTTQSGRNRLIIRPRCYEIPCNRR